MPTAFGVWAAVALLAVTRAVAQTNSTPSPPVLTPSPPVTTPSPPVTDSIVGEGANCNPTFAPGSRINCADGLYCARKSGLLGAYGVCQKEECKDVTASSDPECFGNVTWAMQTGIVTNPDWYADYPVLSVAPVNFRSFQYVLAEKVGPGQADDIAIKDGPGWNCPHPCGFTVNRCVDINSNSPGQCYNNILWAMQTGIQYFPQYYVGTNLTVNSSFPAFQSVLHAKIGNGNGTGWQCPAPCTTGTVVATTVATTTAAALSSKDLFPNTTTIATTTTTGASSGSSFPWWAWLLVVLGILVAAGGAGLLAYILCLKQGAKKSQPPKKKKRSVQPPMMAAQPPTKTPTPPVPPQVEAPATAMESTPLIAPPVYYSVAPQASVQVAPPQYQYVPPRHMMAAPAAAVAPRTLPMVPLVPVTSRSMPMYSAAPALATSVAPVAAPSMQVFDQLDSNHDGVISRAEFNRMT